MYVLCEDRVLPFLISLPPTSLRPVRIYFTEITSARLRFWHVLTGIAAEGRTSRKGKPYARVRMRAIRELSDVEKKSIEQYRAQFAVAKAPDVSSDDYNTNGEGADGNS